MMAAAGQSDQTVGAGAKKRGVIARSVRQIVLGWGFGILPLIPDAMIKRSSSRGAPPRKASKEAATRQARRRKTSEGRSDAAAETDGSPIVGIGASAGGFEAVSE